MNRSLKEIKRTGGLLNAHSHHHHSGKPLVPLNSARVSKELEHAIFPAQFRPGDDPTFYVRDDRNGPPMIMIQKPETREEK
jgi:hypothetical protein